MVVPHLILFCMILLCFTFRLKLYILYVILTNYINKYVFMMFIELLFCRFGQSLS